MGHVTYIGRIGAFAVALGIGAGLTAMPWVATAKPSDPGSTNTSSDAPSSSTSSPESKPLSSSNSSTGNSQTSPAATNSTATEKPVHGKSIEIFSINTATGAVTGQETGTFSHLGKFHATIQGASAVGGDGTLTGTGTFTMVAANGDQLTGTYTLNSSAQPRVVATFTGGTGRFTNASGTVTINADVSASQQGQVLVLTEDCIEEGKITY
jgi:hypothetical protein